MRKYKVWRYYIDGKEVTKKEADKQVRMNFVALEFMRTGEKSSWAVYRNVEVRKE